MAVASDVTILALPSQEGLTARSLSQGREGHFICSQVTASPWSEPDRHFNASTQCGDNSIPSFARICDDFRPANPYIVFDMEKDTSEGSRRLDSR
jgi:hypothetical protein